MLIDAHLHAFPRVHGRIGAGPTRGLGYGEISVGGTTTRLLPPHSRQTVHTLEMLLRHMDLAGVDKAVMLQGSFYGECNDYALRAVKANPRKLAAAAYFDPWAVPPGMAGRSRRLARALREGFSALKMECSVDTGLLGLHPQARLDDPLLDVLWETLEAAGRVLTLDLGAIGSASYQTAAVRTIASSHPRLSIVICHLGQPSPRMENDASLRRLWEEQVSLGLRPNVWMDTAALPAYAKPEKYPFPSAERWLRRAVEIIGAGKLMWGTDIPGLLLHATYAQLSELAQEHTAFLKSAEREQVLGKNAERVYFAGGGAP